MRRLLIVVAGGVVAIALSSCGASTPAAVTTTTNAVVLQPPSGIHEWSGTWTVTAVSVRPTNYWVGTVRGVYTYVYAGSTTVMDKHHKKVEFGIVAFHRAAKPGVGFTYEHVDTASTSSALRITSRQGLLLQLTNATGTHFTFDLVTHRLAALGKKKA